MHPSLVALDSYKFNQHTAKRIGLELWGSCALCINKHSAHQVRKIRGPRIKVLKAKNQRGRSGHFSDMLSPLIRVSIAGYTQCYRPKMARYTLKPSNVLSSPWPPIHRLGHAHNYLFSHSEKNRCMYYRPALPLDVSLESQWL